MCPINEGHGRELLHFGIALSEMVPEDGTIVINKQPQTSLLELGDNSTSSFVPRVVFDATFQQLVNLQLLRANGPFWAQANGTARGSIKRRQALSIIMAAMWLSVTS